ncbi:hypothetical protein T11_3288 [Trichinella zimbabwensis]|uniref:Reverse transcriptase/retrotransposon-derived protein RNase H-like domain-containing protein n=1 Tax=Trichinella zimbabwensis TaxID=268475 RepID=A0A0V1HTE7_9BILA|nr:hypothetical protein T11_3288 [Trichinella zimbabwensis]
MSDEFTFASLNIDLRAKMLFYKLWQAGPLPYGIAQDWANWNRETKSLWNIRIPRWLILFPIKEASSVELHVSGDASKWAYGAMVYVKTVSEYKKTVMFVISKS